MKPVIIIHDYYQNIYITLGKAITALIHSGRKGQLEMLLSMFVKAESHSQCMDVILRYVDIVQEAEVS